MRLAHRVISGITRPCQGNKPRRIGDTTMAQTKSNAIRSAAAATKRTGFDHGVRMVEGGWEIYVPTIIQRPTGDPAAALDQADEVSGANSESELSKIVPNVP